MFVEKGEIWVERICGNGWLWFEYVSQSVCARISMQGSNTGRWGPSDVSIVEVPPHEQVHCCYFRRTCVFSKSLIVTKMSVTPLVGSGFLRQDDAVKALLWSFDLVLSSLWSQKKCMVFFKNYPVCAILGQQHKAG